MAGVRSILLFSSLPLLLGQLLCGRGARAVVIPVDAAAGNDSLCVAAQDLNDSTTEYPAGLQWKYLQQTTYISPCQSLQAALGNQPCSRGCYLDNTKRLPPNLDLQLSPGVYRLTACLGILQASNLTIRSRGDAPGDVIIECATVPNNDYYDNLYVCGSERVRFQGLVFRKCGPFSPNVFLNHSSGLVFDNCTFRDNIGSSLQGQFCNDVTLTNTHFINNDNQQVAEPDVNETSIEELYDSITTGGGFTFFTRGQPATIRIEKCSFVENSANRNDPNNTRPVLLKANGHGGAVLIRLANADGSEITIADSEFVNNKAQVDGGAIYMTLSESVSGSSIFIERSNFTGNTVEEASGGAVSINSFQISFNNTIIVRNCSFLGNSGNAGGAFSIALYDSDINSSRSPDGVNFTECDFVNNMAKNEGTAVGLFSLVHVDQVGFPVGFENCLFMNNTSEGVTQDTSAIAAFRFPITFQGTNRFLGNLGGGVTLLNTQMRASGVLEFDSNTAVFGGGIAMDDRCLLELSPGTNISFTNNVARESGGGIYVEFPPIRFVVDIFNRLCFLQYRDPSGRDIPPQDWEDVAISFINNTARLSGAAIYASDMQQCSWLGNFTTDTSLIFTLPTELADRSPFLYKNNSLFSASNLVNNTNLATAPSTIEIDVDYTTVQPGESLAIGLLARDQVNNAREAVWSLEAPNQDVNLDALSANRDTYVYAVPCAPCLNHTDVTECSCSDGPPAQDGEGGGGGEDGEFSDDFTSLIRLNFSLLRTLGEIESQNLKVEGCHPGYVYNSNTGNCDCDTDNNDLLRCDDNNRYVYLRVSHYIIVMSSL
ncbi:hypothetical protein GBAR_LOCUS524 [Geodia barretti]|uniref:Uncharacterized protein n=1 Tax=Geodia barretti TaxID=519541 RepID=A0AA35QT49_GEOBA|nr:hypothetical protein GBAR_LOCUS524 [Geodia barretti]